MDRMVATNTGGRTVVMQPYLFPYLGYFQLLHACDRFVSLDDAAFIKRGWVNRNQILLNGAAHLFTIPIDKQSQHVAINRSNITADDGWKRKLITTLTSAYGKAPHYAEVFPKLEDLIRSASGSIAQLAERALKRVLEHVGIDRPILKASELGLTVGLAGEERIMAICDAVGTSTYINAAGGRDLYTASHFAERGMELRFIRMHPVRYAQRAPEFVPGLSIIDVIMWSSPAETRALMSSYMLDP